jgi:hypothetical protein
MPLIVPIVEGHGEVDAVPLLLRRILDQRQWWDWSVAHPKRVGNLGNLKKRLKDFIRYARLEKNCQAILILLDLDDGCPAYEARALAAQVRQLHLRCPVAIVLAHREYEAWFLASLDTLAGSHDLPADLVFEGDVESIRDAKGWLTAHKPAGRAYRPAVEQASFTSLMDLDLAQRRSRSFRRLCHALEELIQAAQDSQVQRRVTP